MDDVAVGWSIGGGAVGCGPCGATAASQNAPPPASLARTAPGGGVGGDDLVVFTQIDTDDISAADGL